RPLARRREMYLSSEHGPRLRDPGNALRRRHRDHLPGGVRAGAVEDDAPLPVEQQEAVATELRGDHVEALLVIDRIVQPAGGGSGVGRCAGLDQALLVQYEWAGRDYRPVELRLAVLRVEGAHQ